MKILEEKDALAVVPRNAATVLILRDSDHGPEVLMVRRSPSASFMPNAYVFPGGAVDALDQDVLTDETLEQIQARFGKTLGLGNAAKAFAVATVRECLEECGLWLGSNPPADLHALRTKLQSHPTTNVFEGHPPLSTSLLYPWSRWVTPLGLPKRFDTVFFVCRAPEGQEPSVDEGETTTLVWVRPALAMEAQAKGEFQMEFATVATIRSLVPFTNKSVDAVLNFSRLMKTVPTVHPRLKLSADRKVMKVLLPGEAGYGELFGAGPSE